MSAKTLFYLAAVSLILTRPAYAYLDPSVSSMLFQVMATAAVAVGLFWGRFKRGFSKFFGLPRAKKKPGEGKSVDIDAGNGEG
jgi:hypothetical protein